MSITKSKRQSLEKTLQEESARLDWLDRHASAEHNRNHQEHSLVVWLSPSETSNGVGGYHMTCGPDFRSCIDKFLTGAAVRVG